MTASDQWGQTGEKGGAGCLESCSYLLVPFSSTMTRLGWMSRCHRARHRQDRDAVSAAEGFAVFLPGVQLAFPVR